MPPRSLPKAHLDLSRIRPEFEAELPNDLPRNPPNNVPRIGSNSLHRTPPCPGAGHGIIVCKHVTVGDPVDRVNAASLPTHNPMIDPMFRLI